MLIEFRTENFLSFDQLATLSMLATSDKVHEETNVHSSATKERILKSGAIYGANAAGKSNYIKAMAFMVNMVKFGNNITRNNKLPDFSYKLNNNSKDKPTYFEAVFINDNRKYRYGFELHEGNVVSEWLFHTPTTREAMLFTREDSAINVGNQLPEAKGLKVKPKANQLFLSVVAGYNNEDSISGSVIDWFHRFDILTSFSPNHMLDKTSHLLEFHKDLFEEKMHELLYKLDLLEDFEVVHTGKPTIFPEDMPEEVKAYFQSDEDDDEPSIIVKRKIYEKNKIIGVHEFDLFDHESEGTQKLFILAGFFLDILAHGGTLVIDEMESNLHPLITRKILNIFNSVESNPLGAQLIIATHDTNLLSNSIFRRDQIWFVEKNKEGSSCIFSLAEYKNSSDHNVRKDASYEKDYILGKYGAIPFIGDFHLLMESTGE